MNNIIRCSTCKYFKQVEYNDWRRIVTFCDYLNRPWKEEYNHTPSRREKKYGCQHWEMSDETKKEIYRATFEAKHINIRCI